MSVESRDLRRCSGYPTPRAATARSAAAMCPRPWCRRSIGCRPASTAICTARISRPSSSTSSRPGWAVRRRSRSRPRLSKRWGAEVWLKREDLAHTGAHKINNAVGQTLLAKRLGAKRIIAETGAGQHGVASAAAAARLGLPCVVYMGAVDVERQAPNVGRMQLMGATVVPVTAGDKTLRAAIDEALRDWVSDPDGTYYCLGSAVGSASLSLSGARAAGGDRPRGAGADARRSRAACRTSRSPAWAAARMRSACSIRFSTTPRSQLLGVEAGGRGAGPRRQRGLAHVRHSRRAAGKLYLDPAGRLRPGARDALGVRRSRLFRRRARSMRS